jgi:hypothetical protein
MDVWRLVMLVCSFKMVGVPAIICFKKRETEKWGFLFSRPFGSMELCTWVHSGSSPSVTVLTSGNGDSLARKVTRWALPHEARNMDLGPWASFSPKWLLCGVPGKSSWNQLPWVSGPVLPLCSCVALDVLFNPSSLSFLICYEVKTNASWTH